jgi:hypothetical protein
MEWRGRLADLRAGLEAITIGHARDKQAGGGDNPKESRDAHLQVLLGKKTVTRWPLTLSL